PLCCSVLCKNVSSDTARLITRSVICLLFTLWRTASMAFSAAVQTSKSDAVLGRGAKAWRAAVAASALSRLGGKGGRLYKADSIRRSRSCFALRSASIGSTHGVMVWARARGQVRAGGRSDEPPVLPTWRLSCCLQIFTKGGSVADKGFFIERLPREGTVTFLALVKEKELRNKR